MCAWNGLHLVVITQANPVSDSGTVTLYPTAVHRDTYRLKRLLQEDSGVTFFAARDQQCRGTASVRATF
jgi:hypothetical protein